jgi:hypothetical protein
MTLLAGSDNTYVQIGQREDLTDIVALIDPQDTPFQSNIGQGRPATGVKHEWQTQTLRAAVTNNFQLEGDDSPANLTVNQRTRLYNYCGISRKVGAVSGTAQAIDVAGISDEYDNQVMLSGIELRRDMELILVNNNGSNAGSATAARQIAGLVAWITNVSTVGWAQKYSAANGLGTQAWGLASLTTGTGALTLTVLNASLKLANIAGGKPNMLMLSPRLKQVFSALGLQSSLGGASQVRFNTNQIKAMPLIGAIDTWLSDFGTLQVVSNVQWASDSGTTFGLDTMAVMIQTDKCGASYLRRMFTEPLAKTGDNNKFQILAEYTLQVDAPNAHAAVLALS